jgi:rhomboid-like protein
MIGLDLLLALGQFEGDIVAHYAHLGGALVGLLFTFLWKRRLFI